MAIMSQLHMSMEPLAGCWLASSCRPLIRQIMLLLLLLKLMGLVIDEVRITLFRGGERFGADIRLIEEYMAWPQLDPFLKPN